MFFKDSIQKQQQNLEAYIRKANPRIPDLDIKKLAHEAILESDAYLRETPPVIAITGVTATGKSTLINTIFREKILEEGLTSDTTDMVAKIRFGSGLIIYDTPGAGGQRADLENITRLFFGLEQLKEGFFGKNLTYSDNLPSIDAVPIIDPREYNSVTDSPKNFVKQANFEKLDLILFVTNIKAGTLKGDDTRFFKVVEKAVEKHEIPIIVIVNQIDGEEPVRITESLALVKKTLHREAIPVSAKNDQNIQTIVAEIIKQGPKDFSDIIRETVDRKYRRSADHQIIAASSFVTAVKVTQLITPQMSNNNMRLLASYVLALYGVIMEKYNIDDNRARRAKIAFNDVIKNIKNKEMEFSEESNSGIRTLSAICSVGGIAIAALATVATHGLALPVIIGAIGGSGAGGGAVGTGAGILNGLFKRNRILDDIAPEVKQIKQYISTESRCETAASILAFGKSLRICCDNLEREKQDVDFSGVFKREYPFIQDRLKPFSEELNRNLNNIEQKHLVDKLVANVTL